MRLAAGQVTGRWSRLVALWRSLISISPAENVPIESNPTDARYAGALALRLHTSLSRHAALSILPADSQESRQCLL